VNPVAVGTGDELYNSAIGKGAIKSPSVPRKSSPNIFEQAFNGGFLLVEIPRKSIIG